MYTHGSNSFILRICIPRKKQHVHCTFPSQKRCGSSCIRVPFSPSGNIFIRDEHNLSSAIEDRDEDISPSSDSRAVCIALLAFSRSSNRCLYAHWNIASRECSAVYTNIGMQHHVSCYASLHWFV